MQQQFQAGPYKIMHVGEEYLPLLLALYKDCTDFLSLGPTATPSEAMIHADLSLSSKDGGVYYGIFTPDGILVGVVDFIRSGLDGDPQTAYLCLLMIGEPYRNQGIGETVLHAVEEEILRDPTIRFLKAHVQVNNPSALKFWKRHGFEIIGPAEQQPDTTVTFPLQKTLRPEKQWI